MLPTDDRRLASWRRTVEQFHRSGLSRREFCERKGIKKSSLDYWFKKVRQSDVESALVEVKVAAAPNPSAALEVSVAEWLEKYREDFAVFARIRLGSASTFESMGLDVFSIMMYDDPDLVKEIHRRFSEWSARVVQHLNKLDFDFIWANDDHADTKAPWINMEMWEEFFKPYQLLVANEIKKPWIFHSDGNLFPILDGLLQLGMNAVHPVQPSAMDINQLKAKYGDRVCIVGNIDLDYTLPRGTEAEVEAEVKDRIEKVGKGGGYMISSANSITDYCKVENVWAMSRAIKKYGKYA